MQERPPMWLDRRDGSRGAVAPDQPQHGRLRPGAGFGGAAGAGRDPSGARPRRALAGRPRAVSPLRSDLAHLRRGPSGRQPPRSSRGLVGARLAARHRARHRHRLVALERLLAARRPRPGCGSRAPPTWRWPPGSPGWHASGLRARAVCGACSAATGRAGSPVWGRARAPRWASSAGGRAGRRARSRRTASGPQAPHSPRPSGPGCRSRRS